MEWKLGFIGAGVMAEVMIAGILEEGILAPTQILTSNRRPERAASLHDRYGVQTCLDNRQVAQEVDVLVLSVKPQNLAEVIQEISGLVASKTQVLSVVAGAGMTVIRDGLAPIN